MASIRVVATAKGDVWRGGRHRHVETLCLEGGRRVSKTQAIGNIEHGIETYYTFDDGLRANVVVVPHCHLCADKYMRTDRDSTLSDNLLELRDCWGWQLNA